MSLDEVSQRFAKTTLKQRLAGLGLIMTLMAAGFYFFFYSALTDDEAGIDRRAQALEVEKNEYEEKKQKYLAFRAEVKKLMAEQNELVRVLPTRAEIPSFLQSLHAQAELAGLNIVTFDKQPEVTREFYAEIPVRMVISGAYHQITKFFYSIGQLKRIVNIQDVLLSEPVSTGGVVVLKAKFVASTFRFIDNTQKSKTKSG